MVQLLVEQSDLLRQAVDQLLKDVDERRLAACGPLLFADRYRDGRWVDMGCDRFWRGTGAPSVSQWIHVHPLAPAAATEAAHRDSNMVYAAT